MRKHFELLLIVEVAFDRLSERFLFKVSVNSILIWSMFARQITKAPSAPTEAQEKITDLVREFLGAFYGIDEELETHGLAALWEFASPYLARTNSQSKDVNDFLRK